MIILHFTTHVFQLVSIARYRLTLRSYHICRHVLRHIWFARLFEKEISITGSNQLGHVLSSFAVTCDIRDDSELGNYRLYFTSRPGKCSKHIRNRCHLSFLSIISERWANILMFDVQCCHHRFLDSSQENLNFQGATIAYSRRIIKNAVFEINFMCVHVSLAEHHYKMFIKKAKY